MKSDSILKHKPLLIAGPCSAETEEQVINTAQQLKESGIQLFRAGIWKPRTRPNNFEGIGEIGLKWLQQVKRETGLKVTTEVANKQHVEAALKHDIDVLWIGARTTVNPFSVQEIADALKGIDIPVMVKNPINPDLNLWTGAVERIQKAGIREIGLIHRGFASYGESFYRNKPQWNIPIQIKSTFSDMPMICDVSHICGRRDILQDVAQKAMNLDYDGLMTEVHERPDEAWSDAAQQITPFTYRRMIQEIEWYQNPDEMLTQEGLSDIRSKIDRLDDQLLKALEKRMKLVDEIGHFKKANHIPILQSARWNEIMERSLEKAKKNGLASTFVTKFLEIIHEESINRQQHILRGENEE